MPNQYSLPQKPSDCLVLHKKMVYSKAWLSLTGIASQVYLIFLFKRQIVSMEKRKGKKFKACINSRKIIFTYKDAKEKYGISDRRFKLAIENLILYGFIDIVEPGGSLFKNPTIYGLTDRWMKYGEPDFQEQKRKKRDMLVGYCKKEK